MTTVFCWHHGDKRRLLCYLSQGIVDCPREDFLAKHKLKPGDKIRFSVKVRKEALGQIFAVAELVSETPHYLQKPRSKVFPYGVNLRNIVLLDGTQHCSQYCYKKPPPMNPSHWVKESPKSGNIAQKMVEAGLI